MTSIAYTYHLVMNDKKRNKQKNDGVGNAESYKRNYQTERKVYGNAFFIACRLVSFCRPYWLNVPISDYCIEYNFFQPSDASLLGRLPILCLAQYIPTGRQRVIRSELCQCSVEI